MELNLEDFFEYYPSQDDVDVQKKLAEYYEFQECASGRKDVKLENDTFYTQQRAYQRLGYAFQKIALIAEAGVGKTGCNICLSDYLKNTKQARKNYFITGASQVEDFRNQLVYGLSNSYHMAEKLQGYEKSAKGLLNVINRMIADFYGIMTYDAFVKYVLALTPAVGDDTSPDLLAEEMNRRIDDEFAGCSIFFDEFQFLKITSTNITKVTKGKGDAKVKGQERDRHKNYWTIWRVCQVTTRTRITIASARPITTEPKEFGYAMNWILPLDMQIRLDRKFQDEYTNQFGLRVTYGPKIDWKSLSIDSTVADLERTTKYYMRVLEPYLRGRVMFIAAADTGVTPTYLPLSQPVAPPEAQMQIEQSRENQQKKIDNAKTLKDKARANLRFIPLATKKGGSYDIQGQTYLDYIQRNPYKKGEVKEFKDNNPREILTAVFPKVKGDESARNWGIKAMKAWLTDNYTYKEGVVSVDGKTLKWYLQHSLQSLSISMAYIRNVAVNYPWKGYVFSDLVTGSGVYLLGLALEEGGDVFINGKTYGAFQKYVPGELNAQTIPQGQLHKHFIKYPRYAIISSHEGSGSSVGMTRILSLYNHPDNIHGEYMKYILLSRKGMTGINLMHVMYVFSLFLSHNPSDLYQAIRRALRATSHQALKEVWLKDPLYKDLPFEVSINLLTAVFGNAEEASRSVSIADRTLNKDLNIAPIIRAYKQHSVTAWIFKERNDLNKNQAETSDADYMSNVLKIPGERPEQVIYSNYLLLYCGDKIQAVANKIIGILRREGRYDIQQSSEELSGELEFSIFYLALSSLIVENDYSITDQFGFLCDVIVFDTMLYLNRKYSSVPQGTLCSYYTTNLIAVESRSLGEIIDDYIKSKIDLIYDEVSEMPDDPEILSEYIGNLKIEQKALFLESIIAHPQIELLPPIFLTILEMFSIDLDDPLKPGNLIEMEEPIERIQRISESTVNTKDRSLVFVHNVYVYSKGLSGAGKMSRTSAAVGRIRIFRFKEGVWRDTRDDEAEVYRYIFVDVNNKRNEAIAKKSKIYGKINEGDDKFWIIDKRRESQIAGGNELITGTATIQRKIYIVAYMWELGLRYNPEQFRDHYSHLFDGIQFELTQQEVDDAVDYIQNLPEEDREQMVNSASVLRGSEIKLVNQAKQKYGGENYPAIVYAVRKKTLKFATERARSYLWNNKDEKAKGYNTRSFQSGGRCYSFDPEKNSECNRATEEMVMFFYHYLHSQSRHHGHPKEKLMKMLAIQMHKMGLIYSDSLDDTGIRDVINRIY